MKKKQYILLIACLLLVGITMLTNYKTIDMAKERIIEEQQNKLLNPEPEEIIETEEISFEEGIVAGATAEVEEETENSNQYTKVELVILIISSVILTITIMNLVVTKGYKTSLGSTLHTTKRVIYYCMALVIACSVVPTSIVIASDKKVLNGYETKSSAEKSLAVIEITENKASSNQKEESTEDNTSVIQVANGAEYEGKNLELNKISGNTTDIEGSEIYGLNAAFIAKEASIVSLMDSQIKTTVNSASAFFATGSGTQATLENVTLTTSGKYASALNASEAAEISANQMTIKTSGENACAIKVLDTNSSISITDAQLQTEGTNANLFYSKGKIEATNITGESVSSIGVIENRNSLALTSSNFTTNAEGQNQKEAYSAAFLLYSKESQSESNTFTNAKLDIIDLQITINPQSPWYEQAPLFYVTNTTANINITNTELNYGSNILLKIASNEEYGDIGNNGADVTFTATDQKLDGEIIVDENSKIRLNLNNSIYEGKINTENLSANVDVTFDYTSQWNLTGDSYINTLTITKKDYLKKNVKKYIKSNGYNVYYNAENNEWLEGKTYKLSGGGKLIPLQS